MGLRSVFNKIESSQMLLLFSARIRATDILLNLRTFLQYLHPIVHEQIFDVIQDTSRGSVVGAQAGNLQRIVHAGLGIVRGRISLEDLYIHRPRASLSLRRRWW